MVASLGYIFKTSKITILIKNSKKFWKSYRYFLKIQWVIFNFYDARFVTPEEKLHFVFKTKTRPKILFSPSVILNSSICKHRLAMVLLVKIHQQIRRLRIAFLECFECVVGPFLQMPLRLGEEGKFWRSTLFRDTEEVMAPFTSFPRHYNRVYRVFESSEVENCIDTIFSHCHSSSVRFSAWSPISNDLLSPRRIQQVLPSLAFVTYGCSYYAFSLLGA